MSWNFIHVLGKTQTLLFSRTSYEEHSAAYETFSWSVLLYKCFKETHYQFPNLFLDDLEIE